MKKYNGFYAQSGGPTAVINATACGVIEMARHYSHHIGNLSAGQYGILGAIEECLIDTTFLDNKALSRLRHTPGASFGSCRYKLGSFESESLLYERIFDVFKAHDIRYFFYNGGGDSQDTVYKLGKYSQQKNYPLSCIGIPKTIDNDIPCTDNCPGFGSTAKYVATSVLEIGLDVRGMHRHSTQVFILEVMGRHSGWIAASAGLATQLTGEVPHLILFPEVPFDEALFLKSVSDTIQSIGYCVIVAAEGIRDKQGRLVGATSTKDAFQHIQLGGVASKLAQLIATSLKVKQRWTTLDYLQRSAGHIASQTDIDQAYALGKAAVECAIQGKKNCMPTLIRKSNQPYAWTIGEAHIEQVANQEKCLPPHFISKDGFHITKECREYLTPLIQGESYPPYQEGLPHYWMDNWPTLPKKLPPFKGSYKKRGVS